MQQFKTTRLPFHVPNIVTVTVVVLGSGWRFSIEPVDPPPLATGIRLFYLSVSRVRQKNELGAVGNEKPSFDAVLNRIYLCKKIY